MADFLKRGHSRIFITEFGARWDRVPEYMSYAAVGAVEEDYGEVEPSYVPDDNRYDSWVSVGQTRSLPARPTATVTSRRLFSRSRWRQLAKVRCNFDLQVHFGQCEDPRDFDGGWSFVQIHDAATIVTTNSGELGNLAGDDQGEVMEEISISSGQVLEKFHLNYAEKASSEVAQEIVAMTIADTAGCGDCDSPSDGTKKVFAVSAPAGSSPGVLPEIIYTEDGFTTVGETPIDTLAVGEDPDDIEVIGIYIGVISEDTGSIHYAERDNILDDTETWQENVVDATNGARAIMAASPADIWLACANGYIYYLTSISGSATALENGGTTTENFNDIHAYDRENVVAVGDNNVVLYTTNGSDFTSVTGPAAGINLNCVFVWDEKTWLVGTANGRLWGTTDSGSNWKEITIPNSGSGSIEDIDFASNAVGYLLHTIDSKAYISRTISGGNTWRTEPNVGSIPLADKLSTLTVPKNNLNVVYAGGLADNAADGIIVKGFTS